MFREREKKKSPQSKYFETARVTLRVNESWSEGEREKEKKNLRNIFETLLFESLNVFLLFSVCLSLSLSPYVRSIEAMIQSSIHIDICLT